MKIPETDQEIDEFIRKIDSGEIDVPPAPNARLCARMAVTLHELDRLKKFIREEVLREIYNQLGQNTELITRLTGMVKKTPAPHDHE